MSSACIKSALAIFVHCYDALTSYCFQAYGFSVSRLFNLLMDMRDQYGEILLKRWAYKFREIFNEDNYTEMCIETERDSQSILRSFPYEGMDNLLLAYT